MSLPNNYRQDACICETAGIREPGLKRVKKGLLQQPLFMCAVHDI